MTWDDYEVICPECGAGVRFDFDTQTTSCTECSYKIEQEPEEIIEKENQ